MKKLFLLLILSSSLLTLNAQYTVIHKFNDTTGGDPSGSLIASGDTLYGMASQGGTAGYGIIFSVKTDGSHYTVLHNFVSTDGRAPLGSLLLKGNMLYGMASQGGSVLGNGVIFSMQTNGSNYTVLHTFGGSPSDGSSPLASLVLSGDTLYGTTQSGSGSNDGVIFSIQTNGSNYNILHIFNTTDGSGPRSTLVCSGSTLYGLAPNGGVNNDGVIFSVNTNGSNYTVMHNFNGADGNMPYGSLALSGNTLYGMVQLGGLHNLGSVFSIQTNGSSYTDLHDFNGPDGEGSWGSITIVGSTLYGMTMEGGAHLKGVIFSMQNNGTGFAVQHNFNGFDGEGPIGDLLFSNSALYGMTNNGGSDSCLKCGYGVIFKDSLTSPEGIAELGSIKNQTSIYPNPSKGIFTFEVKNEELRVKNTIEVYNVLGEKVYSSRVFGTTFTIDLSGKPAGIYLYRITSENGNLVSSGKLIIE